MARRPAAARHGENDKPRKGRGPSALVVGALLLLGSLAGLVGWLAVTFDREAYDMRGLGAVVVEVPLPPPPPAPSAAPPAPSATTAPPPPPATAPEPELALAPEPPPVAPTERAPEPSPEGGPAPPPAAPSEPVPEPRVAALPPVSPAPAPTVAPPPEEPVRLAAAPDPDLIAESAKGPLPVIAPDGRQAWQVYGRPFHDETDRPRVGIVVASMGLSQSATRAAIQQLPSAVTLAFAPYASDLKSWIEQARAAGHEVMLQLPMEPFDYPINDPGPYTLLTSLTIEDNIDRLEWLLGRFTGYVGVTNYMGSRFTSSPEHVRPILAALKRRGLMFLDSRWARNSVAGGIAVEIDLPRALNNRFLDNVASRAAVDARLDDLERIARATGYAVGIGFPYPVTIERLAAWAATLRRKDLVLTPVSALANKQSG